MRQLFNYTEATGADVWLFGQMAADADRNMYGLD